MVYMKHVIRSLSYVIRVLAEFQQFCQAEFPAILAALLLFVFFVLREEFASLFQTFSRSDPPGKAPLTRGRYVFPIPLQSCFWKPKTAAEMFGLLYGHRIGSAATAQARD